MKKISVADWKTISFKILSQQEYTYENFGTEGLTKIEEGHYELKNYEYHFDVLVKNQNGDERKFKIIFENDCYSSVMEFGGNGQDFINEYYRHNKKDQSKELGEFCKNEFDIIYILQSIAQIYADIELRSLRIDKNEEILNAEQ